MAILNLQQRMYKITSELRKKFFDGVELPNYIINVGHFAREHGHHLSNWSINDDSGSIPMAEIYIDAMAFNKGAVHIVSILHHEMVMISMDGAGTGSFDSRTKEFRDGAEKCGLKIYPTDDRFKFRSAKALLEHHKEWVDWFETIVETPEVVTLESITVGIYPDLVSKRRVDSYRKALEAGALYPTPGDLIKPGTGGRTKVAIPTIKVKLRPDTTKIAALDEASTQYDKLRTLMDSDLNPEDVALGIAEDLV